MKSGKKIQIIESIKNMPDQEADILEVFVAGFRAGKITAMAEFCIFQIRKYPFTEKFLKFTVWRGARRGIIS